MPPQSSPARRVSLEWGTLWALAATVIIALVIFGPPASFPFFATKAFVLSLGAVITLALYILARLARGNLIVPPMLLLLALWLPALAYALSAVFAGGSFTAALWGTAFENDTLGFMLAVSALGTLAALALRRPDQYRAFLKVGARAAGLVIAAIVLVLVIGQFAPSFVSPSFALVGSQSDLAAVLGLAVVAVLLAVRSLELSARVGRFLLIGGVLALFLLAVLNVSLVWILLALASLALFVEAVMARRSAGVAIGEIEDGALFGESDAGMPAAEAAQSTRSFLAPLGVLAVSLFFLIGSSLGGALAGVLHAGSLNVRPSWSSTLAVGQKVYHASPVFGSGPGTFGVEWLKYRDASLNSTVFWNVDFASGIGFIPTSFVTTGVVGALAWIALMILLLFFGARTLILRAPEDPVVQYVSTLSFVAAVFLFAIAIFDLPGPTTLALAFVAIGVFVSTMRYARGASQWGIVFSRSPRLGFVVVFFLTLLLLGCVGTAYAVIERFIAVSELSRATAAYAAGNADTAAAAADRALAFAPLPAAYALQAAVADKRLSDIISSAPSDASQAQKDFQTALSAGINAALTATRLAPDDYRNWIALADLYAAAVPLSVPNAYESAKAALAKAIDLNPTNPQLYYALAQLDIAKKDQKAAEDDLTKAVLLKQDYTAAIFLLSQIYVQEGNLKNALASAEAAAYFTPKDANVLFQLGVLRAASGDYAGSAQALEAAVSANPQFANARYFLAAVYAKQKDYAKAHDQVQAIADLSADNAKAVAGALDALAKGQDPFPANLLTITPTPAAATGTAGAAGQPAP